MARPLLESHDLLSGLLQSGLHSDLVVRCGQYERRVHKCIVCSQSDWFRIACEKNKWKEGECGEINLKAAEDNNADIVDDDPRAVELMIDYLYTHDYDPATSSALENCQPGCVEPADGQPKAELQEQKYKTVRNESSSQDPWQPDSLDFDDPWGPPRDEEESGPERPPPAPKTVDPIKSYLEMHAKMLVIASKYHIQPLRDTALEKFRAQTQQPLATPDLIATILIVFNVESASEVRDSLRHLIIGKAREMLQHDSFREAVEGIEGLAFDLFHHQADYIYRR